MNTETYSNNSWLVAWNATAVLLFLRGLARGPVDVPDWQVGLVAVGIVLSASLARSILIRSQDSARNLALILGSFTGGTIVFGLWLTPMLSTATAVAFVWILVVSSEALWVYWYHKNTTPKSRVLLSGPIAEEPLNEQEDGCPLPEGTSQRIHRETADQGQETISGLLRVQFNADQRMASAFAGFVPPLIPDPQVDAEIVWGAEADVQIADVHAQGVEFCLRRPTGQLGEDETILAFYAAANVKQQSA